MPSSLQKLLQSPLESPVLQDGDTAFRGLVSRLRPSQLEPGQVAISKNMRYDEAGAAKVREGWRNVSGGLTTTAVIPFLKESTGTSALVLIDTTGAYCTGAAISPTGTIQITTKDSGGSAIAHGIPSTGGMVNLASFSTGGSTDINGNRAATWVSSSVFNVFATDAIASRTGGIVGAIKLSGGIINVHGACRFSDPTSSNDESIIIAYNEKAVSIKVSTLVATNIAYPAVTVDEEAHLQQEFGKVMLRREGKTTLIFDPQDGSTGFGGTPAFTKVATGTLVQPVELSATATVSTAGKVLMAVSGHLLKSGDKVTITDASTSGLTTGAEHRVTVSDVDNFYIFANVKTNASGGITVKMRKTVTVGGGYINAPAAAFGTLAGQRVFVPYTHTEAASPAVRSPAVRDEIIASDIFNPQVFDPIFNQFRMNAGAADHVVGMHPFGEDSLVVFNRNSIHRLVGVSGSLLDVSSHVLSAELGCVARKSIVYHAGAFLFLSDDGVMGLTFADALNLRGTDLPLSEAIDAEFKRVNRDYMDKAVACYSDNRYYLAVPTGESTECNEIWVYSFLNKSWESIDTASSEGFTVTGFIPAKSGKINEVYAVTADGGVVKISNTGRADDLLYAAAGASSPAVTAIPAHLRTRGYTHGSIERKRFNHVDLHLKSDDEHASAGEITLLTEDPDETIVLGTLEDRLGSVLAAGEGASVRSRTGNPRGFSAQIDWVPTSGRPELRGVAIRATPTFNSPTSAK